MTFLLIWKWTENYQMTQGTQSGHNSHEEQTFQNPLKPGRPEIYCWYMFPCLYCLNVALDPFESSETCQSPHTLPALVCPSEFRDSCDKFWLRAKSMRVSLGDSYSNPQFLPKIALLIADTHWKCLRRDKFQLFSMKPRLPLILIIAPFLNCVYFS